MEARKALDLFSAFICGGFFVALLLLRTEIKRYIVVEENSNGTERDTDRKSNTRSEPQNVMHLTPASGM